MPRMIDSRYVKEGQERVLAFYFSTLGFGYSYMNSPIEVIDKGMLCITPVNNAKTLMHVKRLVKKLKPECIVIEDSRGELSYKSIRIKTLLKNVERFTKQKGIVCYKYSRSQIRMVFSNWNAKTRYEIAKVIARNVWAFSNILFQKPKYPRIESYRSVLFDSASLAITHYYITQ